MAESGLRPDIDTTCPQLWRLLMQACWVANAADRPSTASVHEVLSLFPREPELEVVADAQLVSAFFGGIGLGDKFPACLEGYIQGELVTLRVDDAGWAQFVEDDDLEEYLEDITEEWTEEEGNKLSTALKLSQATCQMATDPRFAALEHQDPPWDMLSLQVGLNVECCACYRSCGKSDAVPCNDPAQQHWTCRECFVTSCGGSSWGDSKSEMAEVNLNELGRTLLENEENGMEGCVRCPMRCGCPDFTLPQLKTYLSEHDYYQFKATKNVVESFMHWDQDGGWDGENQLARITTVPFTRVRSGTSGVSNGDGIQANLTGAAVLDGPSDAVSCLADLVGTGRFGECTCVADISTLQWDVIDAELEDAHGLKRAERQRIKTHEWDRWRKFNELLLQCQSESKMSDRDTIELEKLSQELYPTEDKSAVDRSSEELKAQQLHVLEHGRVKVHNPGNDMVTTTHALVAVPPEISTRKDAEWTEMQQPEAVQQIFARLKASMDDLSGLQSKLKQVISTKEGNEFDKHMLQLSLALELGKEASHEAEQLAHKHRADWPRADPEPDAESEPEPELNEMSTVTALRESLYIDPSVDAGLAHTSTATALHLAAAAGHRETVEFLKLLHRRREPQLEPEPEPLPELEPKPRAAQSSKAQEAAEVAR
eukprot:COSAG05_NODE_33_length_28089_cov_31.909289_34_plen_655_part_00